MTSEAGPYVVRPTRCDCHPETCACSPYEILKGEEVVARGWVRDDLQKLATEAGQSSVTSSDGPGVEDGPWAAGWLLRSIGPGATNENMERLYRAADALVAHVGMVGDIDSHHRLTWDLLAVLNKVKP